MRRERGINRRNNPDVKVKDSTAGITLVSLVVTIIILIILAGVSINLTLGENGIITKAKQAKENIELAQIEEQTALNELYMQMETEGASPGTSSYDAMIKLTQFKTAIANAIEEAGGTKPENTANETVYVNAIKEILVTATSNATATADDIAKGKTAYVNGQLITGVFDKSNSGSGEYIKYYSFYGGTVNFTPTEDFKWIVITNNTTIMVPSLEDGVYKTLYGANATIVNKDLTFIGRFQGGVDVTKNGDTYTWNYPYYSTVYLLK